MPTRLLSPTLRRTLTCLLLVALAMMQTLGLVHRALNGHATASAHIAASATPADTATHFLQALFTGHHDERDCKLFDQLAHADLALGDAARALSAQVVPQEPPLRHRTWHIASEAAGYLARGPPSQS